MNLKPNEIWNEFINQHYDQLIAIGRKMHRDAEDLVHVTYLCCRDKENVRNMLGYFVQVMRRQAYSGKFKANYKYTSYEFYSEEVNDVPSDAIAREQMELFIDRLHKFDRLVWKLHVEGYSMVEISKGAGIPLQTLYNSLAKTRKTIKQCFLHQEK